MGYYHNVGGSNYEPCRLDEPCLYPDAEHFARNRLPLRPTDNVSYSKVEKAHVALFTQPLQGAVIKPPTTFTHTDGTTVHIERTTRGDLHEHDWVYDPHSRLFWRVVRDEGEYALVNAQTPGFRLSIDSSTYAIPAFKVLSKS